MTVVENLDERRMFDEEREKKRAEKFLGTVLPEDFSVAKEDEVFSLDSGQMGELMLERAPFFFVDRAIVINKNMVWGSALMTAERSEGHFPGRPIVPLIDLCKAMAQTGLILVSINNTNTNRDVPIGISSGKSKALAKDLIDAPARIVTRAILTGNRFTLYFAEGTTYLESQRIGTLEQMNYTLVDREKILKK